MPGMTLERPLAFLAFSVAMAATPGPSNALLTTTGAIFGLRRGFPCLLGVGLGMASMMFVVAFGLGSVILDHPAVLAAIRWCGVATLLWLAWRIAIARPGPAATAARPLGLLGAAAFQWVNPKAWLACASATAAFLDRRAGSAAAQSAAIALLFLAACLPSGLPWLASGAAMHRWQRSERAFRLLNLALGALLAASAALVLW
jgi:threonine/homoserine/homoserine lactone efflux protein